MKKQSVSMLAVVSLVISVGCLTQTAQASDEYFDVSASAEAVESVTEHSLEAEGFDVENIEIENNELIVETETDADGADSTQLDLEVDTGTAEAEFEISEESDGTTISSTFHADITTATENRIIFSLRDDATGDTYSYDSDDLTESVAFVIPLAYAGVALAALLKAIAVGTAIVVGGVFLYEASVAVSKILAKRKSQSSSQRRDYFSATRNGARVYINGSGLTKSQAMSQGRARRDIWSISATLAKQLARDLNPSGNPIGAEKHGRGYMWHYHPRNHSPNMHSFYGTPA